MDDTFLASLRCPLDPRREATLSREHTGLVCSGCGAGFPIKNGIPILTPDDAQLPSQVRSIDRLPCVRHTRHPDRQN